MLRFKLMPIKHPPLEDFEPRIDRDVLRVLESNICEFVANGEKMRKIGKDTRDSLLDYRIELVTRKNSSEVSELYDIDESGYLVLQNPNIQNDGGWDLSTAPNKGCIEGIFLIHRAPSLGPDILITTAYQRSHQPSYGEQINKEIVIYWCEKEVKKLFPIKIGRKEEKLGKLKRESWKGVWLTEKVQESINIDEKLFQKYIQNLCRGRITYSRNIIY